MVKNAFESVDRRFFNQKSSAVHVVRFRHEPVGQVLQSVSAVYKTLDFADEYQAQLGMLLWRLRCTVLFAMTRYDHEELRLAALGEEISDFAEQLPGSKKAVALLGRRLSTLLGQKVNPKFEWVLKQDWSADETVAIFALMAMRQSFGAEMLRGHADSRNGDLEIITLLEQLGQVECSTLVVPGTLQYLSYGLFMKLFHKGIFRKFHVLLYVGERLSLKSRLLLPDSSLFPKRAEDSGLNINRTDDSTLAVEGESEGDPLDPARIFDASGELDKYHSDGCRARFLLFDDGSGWYLAERQRIRVWRPHSPGELAFVYPAQLLEGEFVFLEQVQRKELLDRSDGRPEFSAELDATSIWRKPLRAMLLSSSPAEVARRMMATPHIDEYSRRHASTNAVELSDEAGSEIMESGSSEGVRNLQTNVSRWADGSVYGPGDLQYFLALVQVLSESGDLEIQGAPESDARRWFKHLEKLRAGRKIAGVDLSAEIGRMLKDALNSRAVMSDGVELQLKNGMLVSVHQLAMIGDRVSIVPVSLLKNPL